MARLAKSEKIHLVQLARRAIERRLSGQSAFWETTPFEKLKQQAGAFVTLHLGGELRGCIGRVEAKESLERVVQGLAVAAATQDFRFSSVTQADLPLLEIEISVLSPLTTISGVEEIQVGKHGLVVRKGKQSGLLLPQVASDHGWDGPTFLSQTCLKAGLPRDYWKSGELEIRVFSAEVFSEKDLFVPDPSLPIQ